MPLFGKRKSKLSAAISDAAVDARAYDKLYDAFAKHPDAPAETLEYVMENVVSKQQKEPKLRSRLMPHSSKSGGEATAVTGIGRPIAYLTVLHGVVWSFPREMATLFTGPETGALLYKVITSTYIPVTVRETLLCMVSNWCILFRESMGARLNLEGVVDTIKEAINLRPSASLLRAPPTVREQGGWPYPMAITPHSPLGVAYNAQGNMFLPANSVYRQQPTMDPVFLSQQRELTNSRTIDPGARPRDHSAPVSRSAIGPESSDLAPEFIAHMEKSAQELRSLCDILTETLVSLDVEEDPSENLVVGDMVAGVKNRKVALLNFIGMLSASHEAMLSTLTEVADCADRCLWLYDKTINSHNEWKAIQESLKTSAAEEARKRAVSSALRPHAEQYQPESSTSAARLYAAASSAAISGSSSDGIGGMDKNSREVPIAASASNTSYSDDFCNNRSASYVPSTQGMSSKAKGKMPDIPANTGSSDWDSRDGDHGAYGDSAYASNSYGNSAYGASGEGSSRRV
ncbi:hypothetical protein GGI20_002428 [Coemansia sp. BCRC 34301]|nr:hypothetical protein GGI20_002428 [Coemansia sp. BCRC 34301]